MLMARTLDPAPSAPPERVSEEIPGDVRLAQAGDRAATERLLKERLPRIRNLVRYLVRGDELVDDISQQVLIAVIRGLHTFEGSGRWGAWVDRITARETFAYLRRVRADHAKARDAAPDLRALRLQRAEASVRDAYAERRTAVQLLETLPDEQRLVIALHHVAGMSLPEVSETLAIPFETARSRARLGMQKLRAQLAEADLGADQRAPSAPSDQQGGSR